MVLHIGEDFSRRIAAGEQVELQLLLDGRRSNAAQILTGYAARIIERYDQELAESAGKGPPAAVIARAWFNPNFKPLWSAVPALFAALTAVVGFMVSSLAVTHERELGTFDQLLVSPLQPVEILLGKTVYLAAIIGIGLFISSLALTQQRAVIGIFIYLAPAVLLSGYATSVENMPDRLQWLTQTNPITHFIIICKGIFLKDVPPSVIRHHTWPMALIAAATLSAGAWLFRRRVA